MSKKMRSMVLAGCLVIFAFSLLSSAALAKEPFKLTFMGAGLSASSYIMGQASADVSNSHPWLRVEARSTPGALYMMRALNKDAKLQKNTSGTWGNATMWLGTQGMPPFEKKVTGMKVLCNMNILSQWLVTMDPDIKTPEDVKGKKVALGKAAQVNWGYEPALMIETGWGLKDQVHISYVGPRPAVQAMIDGTADLAIVGVYLDPITFKFVPHPALSELIASGKKFHHVPWGKECIEKAKSETGIPIGIITIPDGKIEGQSGDIVTYADNLFVGVHESFPDDAAKEFVKLWMDNYKSFKDYHAVGKLVTPEGMHYGLSKSDLHPGAVKAYEEAGFSIPNN